MIATVIVTLRPTYIGATQKSPSYVRDVPPPFIWWWNTQIPFVRVQRDSFNV